MAKVGYKKRKWGESIVRKTLKLPINTVEKLKIVKDILEEDWETSVSFETVIERLLSSEGLGHLNPSVYKRYRKIVDSRAEFEHEVKKATSRAIADIESKAKIKGSTLKEEALSEKKKAAEELKSAAPIVPEEGEVWNTQYYFAKEGKKVEAYAGYWGMSAEIDGNELMYDELIENGWRLEKEDGIIINSEQQAQIWHSIKNHKDL